MFTCWREDDRAGRPVVCRLRSRKFWNMKSKSLRAAMARAVPPTPSARAEHHWQSFAPLETRPCSWRRARRRRHWLSCELCAWVCVRERLFPAGDGFPRTQNSAVQCSPTVYTSRTFSRTTGSQGNMWMRCWRWRETSPPGFCRHSWPAASQCAFLSATAGLDSQGGCHQKLKTPTSTRTMSIYSLAAAAYICIKLHSARYPDPAPSQLPDPRQPATPWPTFSRLSLLFSTGASLTTFRWCIQPGRSTKSSLKNIASWSQWTMRWRLTHRETGWNSLQYASLWGFSNFNCAFRRWLAHLSRAFLLVYWQAGPVHRQWLRPGLPILLGLQVKSHGSSPACFVSAFCEPALTWFGPPLSVHVLLHSPWTLLVFLSPQHALLSGFESRIFVGTTENLPGWEKLHAKTVAWSYDKDSVSWRTKKTAVVQSVYSVLGRPYFQGGGTGNGWRRLQIALKCLYVARMGIPDIVWSVNKFTRWITKWTKACDKRLNRLISYIHHTSEYKQYCHVGNTAKQCRLGLFQDSDFARDLEDSKSTSGGTLCIFGSHTFVPMSSMCKKQTSVSHSSTESEISLWKLDWGWTVLPALDLWDLIVSVLGNVSRVSDGSGKPESDVHKHHKSHNKIDVMKDIDAVLSNVQSARQEGKNLKRKR